MDLTPKTVQIAATSRLPLLTEADDIGAHQVIGRVMAIGPADPVYGADEGVRVAFICDEAPTGQGAPVSVALDQHQMPDLRVGERVRVYGCPEALTATLDEGLLEFGVLAALAIYPA